MATTETTHLTAANIPRGMDLLNSPLLNKGTALPMRSARSSASMAFYLRE
jgi:hypothetical protein